MNIRMLADLEEVISDLIDNHAENSLSHYVHDTLASQMAAAAALVFDSAQDAQEFYEREKREGLKQNEPT